MTLRFLFVIALATASTVHLLHTATVLQSFRNALDRWLSPSRIGGFLLTGFHCSYCLAFWMATCLAGLWWLTPIGQPLAMLLAAIWIAHHLIPLFAMVQNVAGVSKVAAFKADLDRRRIMGQWDATRQDDRPAA